MASITYGKSFYGICNFGKRIYDKWSWAEISEHNNI